VAEAEPKSSIQVIERMMKLRDVLASHEKPAGLKALAGNLHPSTAHRIDALRSPALPIGRFARVRRRNPRKQLLELARWNWLAEEKTLHLVAAEPL
jgi:hypothetical protein